MQDIFLLLGSNLGERIEFLKSAVDRLNMYAGNVVDQSSYYETSPWGNFDQPGFINQAINLRSAASPMKLLEAIWSIEGELGRERVEKWGARTIDIDILFYGSDIIDLPELTIPHKLMQERRFVLMPLAEIAPNFEHPIFKKTIKELLFELTDQLSVKKLTKYS